MIDLILSPDQKSQCNQTRYKLLNSISAMTPTKLIYQLNPRSEVLEKLTAAQLFKIFFDFLLM
jgi:hypothetical protein